MTNNIELKEDQISLARKRTSLALERNLMAAQRTFTSWIRTGLAGVGGGVALTKILSFSHLAHQVLANLIGQLLILWGVLIFIFAFIGYGRTCSKLLLEDKSLNTSFWGICIISITLIVVSIILLIITQK